MRRPGGNNAFLVSAVGRRSATAGGHMRPVRGTLPSDRRKSCRVPQGLSSHWGAGGLGVSGSQSRCCQGSRLHVPPRLPEQGLPPQPWAPEALLLLRRCRIQRFCRQKVRGSLGFILYPLQNAYESPSSSGCAQMDDFGPLCSLESCSSARPDSERPSSSSIFSSVFLYWPRDQTPEKGARAACHPLLDPQPLSRRTM